MQTLINYLDYLVRMADITTIIDNKKAFFNQAFGAIQYHINLHPKSRKTLEVMWNDVYRPEFEKRIYEKPLDN